MRFVNNQGSEKFGVKFKLVGFTIVTTNSGYDTTTVSNVAKFLSPFSRCASNASKFYHTGTINAVRFVTTQLISGCSS